MATHTAMLFEMSYWSGDIAHGGASGGGSVEMFVPSLKLIINRSACFFPDATHFKQANRYGGMVRLLNPAVPLSDEMYATLATAAEAVKVKELAIAAEKTTYAAAIATSSDVLRMPNIPLIPEHTAWLAALGEIVDIKHVAYNQLEVVMRLSNPSILLDYDMFATAMSAAYLTSDCAKYGTQHGTSFPPKRHADTVILPIFIFETRGAPVPHVQWIVDVLNTGRGDAPLSFDISMKRNNRDTFDVTFNIQRQADFPVELFPPGQLTREKAQEIRQRLVNIKAHTPIGTWFVYPGHYSDVRISAQITFVPDVAKLSSLSKPSEDPTHLLASALEAARALFTKSDNPATPRARADSYEGQAEQPGPSSASATTAGLRLRHASRSPSE